MNTIGQKNKRLLFFPFNLLSHYLRCITLAEQYPEYEIMFAYSETYYPYMLDKGYACFKVESFDPEVVMDCAKKFDFSWLNIKDTERVLLSQVEAIKAFKPDLVIGDTSPTLKMAAEKTGVKYVALMNGYMTKYYAQTRRLSRTHPGYGHLSKLPPYVSDAITDFAEKIAFKMVHKPFKKIRKKYSLKKLSSYLDEMEGDENLICDPGDLFPQRGLPANYRFTGPLLFKSGYHETELLHQIDPEKKTICVCMGSSGSWEALDFLSGQEYMFCNIITAGDKNNCIKGRHVLHREFINLEKVLPYCALLICHGGNGTIHLGLKHKVPMLCLTSHFEQEWNVHRLEQLGLGKCINDNPAKAVEAFLKIN